MENTYLSPSNQIHGRVSAASETASRQSANGRFASRYPQFLKNSANYIVDALGEGLKQNFLGSDINMEFLTLTVRSFASTSAKALQQFVTKASVAGQSIAQKRNYLNSLLFHNHNKYNENAI